jgi:hypothetical protein
VLCRSLHHPFEAKINEGDINLPEAGGIWQMEKATTAAVILNGCTVNLLLNWWF